MSVFVIFILLLWAVRVLTSQIMVGGRNIMSVCVCSCNLDSFAVSGEGTYFPHHAVQKEDHIDTLDQENQKLLFLMGMREGELAQVWRHYISRTRGCLRHHCEDMSTQARNLYNYTRFQIFGTAAVNQICDQNNSTWTQDSEPDFWNRTIWHNPEQTYCESDFGTRTNLPGYRGIKHWPAE